MAWEMWPRYEKESSPTKDIGELRSRAGAGIRQTEQRGRVFFYSSLALLSGMELIGTHVDSSYPAPAFRYSPPPCLAMLILYLARVVPWWEVISRSYFPNCGLDTFFKALGKKERLLINGVFEVLPALGGRMSFVFWGKWVKSYSWTWFLFAF